MLFNQDYVVFIGCATDCGKLPFLIKRQCSDTAKLLGCGMTDNARSLVQDDILLPLLVTDFCARLQFQDPDKNVSSIVIDEIGRSSRSIARYFTLISEGTWGWLVIFVCSSAGVMDGGRCMRVYTPLRAPPRMLWAVTFDRGEWGKPFCWVVLNSGYSRSKYELNAYGYCWVFK